MHAFVVFSLREKNFPLVNTMMQVRSAAKRLVGECLLNHAASTCIIMWKAGTIFPFPLYLLPAIVIS